MLTDARVKTAKLGHKPYKLADSGGLFLLVNPSGSKLWRYKYYISGYEKLLALGRYPEISLAEARERHLEARKLVAHGIDPNEEKKKAKAKELEKRQNTFEAVALEWLAAWRVDRSNSHVKAVGERLKNHLFPAIGGRPVADINAPEVLAVLRRIEERGTLEMVKRSKTIISQVIRYAIITGRRIDSDPCSALKGALATPKAQNMPTLTDPADVAKLMVAIRGYATAARTTPVVAAALRLAPLVFVRPGELRRARWANIDLEAARWTYAASKTGAAHDVPLSRQAMEILRGIHPKTGHGEFVFPGGRPGRPMSEAAINRALQTMGYDTKTEITAHGFRAMARTLLAERLHFPPEVIEHQLAHRVPDALGTAYNRTKYLAQRQEMMQAWADYLDELADSLWPVKNGGVNS